MKKLHQTIPCLIAFVAANTLSVCLLAAAQVPNEGLANRIVAVRNQGAQLARQFNWNNRTEILQKGTMQDIRIELESFGPDGTLQRSLLNDTPGKLPGLFLRRAIEENQRKQMEEMLAGLRGLAEQYTLPGSGKIVEFLAGAQIQPLTSPQGSMLLQVTGSSVIVPGDHLTLILDGATYKTRRVDVSTTYQGDPVTLTATFNSLPSGMNFMQYCTVELPKKQITVMIHNFDFVQND